MGLLVDILPPLGFDPEEDFCLMTNGTGAVIALGDVVEIDFSVVDSVTRLWTTVIAMATADLSSGIFLTPADQDIPIGGVGRFMVEGLCQPKIASTTVIAGDRLIGTNAAVGLTESAAEAATGFRKIIGIAKEANTVANARKYVQFSGYKGFSQAGG